MNNLINWFEIPADDFDRAIAFYKKVMSIEINEVDMFGTKMGFMPSDGNNVSGAIVQGEGYSPSDTGTLIYLHGGDDLQPMLDKVESNKGKILLPKTMINPEMGYFALFMDTEGNKMAFHSMH